jgi:tetratricopeptide (TPR) repeat protein
MSAIIEEIFKGIVPGFITDMVARGFWWALLGNLIYQTLLSFIGAILGFILSKINKTPTEYQNPYLNILSTLFPFYIWHIRHGVGWLIYAIAVTVLAVILLIYRLIKDDNGTKTNNASTYFNRGKEHIKNKDYDSAIVDFNESIRINPNDASVYFYRGNAYLNKSDYSSAIVDYTLSIKIDPNDPSAYNNRGFAYESIGDKQRAYIDYQSAIQLDPNETMYRNNLKRVMGL